MRNKKAAKELWGQAARVDEIKISDILTTYLYADVDGRWLMTVVQQRAADGSLSCTLEGRGGAKSSWRGGHGELAGLLS